MSTSWTLLLVSLGFLGFGTASADELTLTWNECAAGGGVHQRTASCNNVLAIETLLPVVELSAPVDSVIGMEIVIDVIGADPALPNWWQFQPGGCNAGALNASASYAGIGACTDPWSGNGIALAQTWWLGQPRGGGNQARLVVSSIVRPGEMVRLEADTPYYTTNIRLSHAQSAGGCTGCTTGVCLVLNSIQLLRVPGSSVPEVQVLPSGNGTSNRATWQNDLADCSVVPARNMTWGAIKSLYR